MQAHFRCLGVDLRGNGGDTPSGPGHNMLYFEEDIYCVIQALQLSGQPPTVRAFHKSIHELVCLESCCSCWNHLLF